MDVINRAYILYNTSYNDDTLADDDYSILAYCGGYLLFCLN